MRALRAAASGFYGSKGIELCGYDPVGLRKVFRRRLLLALRSNTRMRCAAMGFTRAHHCAAATHFRGCYARVEATAMAEADLQNTPRAVLVFVARGWTIGVNVESAK
jgi:hypothetical protein